MFIDQSIESFESWRDRQHDRPEPDSEAPDEQISRSFTHDYPEDTALTYTRMGAHAELKLTFSSEDPDAGVEELLYAGDQRESMAELAAALHAELTAWLDAQDTSSFAEQQGIPDTPDISPAFGEYALWYDEDGDDDSLPRGMKRCEMCRQPFTIANNRQMYCPTCAEIVSRQQAAIRQRKSRRLRRETRL